MKNMNLGGMGIYRNVRNFLRKEYKPYEYWTKRGKTYISEKENPLHRIQEERLIEFLKTINFKSILEFGCGYGRISQKLLHNFTLEKYTAFDLSVDQISHAKAKCQSDIIKFEISSIEEFSDTSRYDLVIGVDVLLHVKPENIISILKKLLSHSQKYFIHIDPHFESNWNPSKNTHAFKHDYESIYSNLGLKYEKIPISKEHSIFCVYL